ncbi:hypothetical protein OB2597_12968 [Pseudooceanicola batsensis HTCC2597]|uniref:Uncharacterized protein n=1 Tax=Pseudooceanicola batsensis (strain ATCC BAA-863 / DSM 15984 / KCTC 12145 / HTCC2597) TaxID=252305 RepID=A3TY22_PSEBH|nr:hypothetical protein [Pseudooceanicola batsensis]EAQ03056.1 hypothetical protein OB2597_12968 [Pseudooceanicola batsensis HTCC2597]
MRHFALSLFLSLAALPLHADVVENDVIKVFGGKWVQSKDPGQNGILMYLTQERSAAGEYFSIRCEGADRSVRLAYPRRRAAGDVGLTVDGREFRVPAEFTGRTKDPHFLKGNVFGYELVFADAAAQADFLEQLRRGRMLRIEGHTLPVDLSGAGQAVREQAAYCR